MGVVIEPLAQGLRPAPVFEIVNYLLSDHLGSTSLAVDASTGDVIETRYKPCPYRVLREGEVRYTTPNQTLPTRYTFTGQYSYVNDDATDLGNAGFGLMFYNARWYDSTTGRFAQADTVVPGGVQGLDRYAYVNNSPVKYVDPSGHEIQGRCNYLKNYNCQAPEGAKKWEKLRQKILLALANPDNLAYGQDVLEGIADFYGIKIAPGNEWLYKGTLKMKVSFGFDEDGAEIYYFADVPGWTPRGDEVIFYDENGQINAADVDNKVIISST